MSGTFSGGSSCGSSSGSWTALRAIGGSQPIVTSVTSAASFDSGQLAFLGYASIFGSGLSDGVYASPDSNYGTKLGPTEIFACSSTLFTVGQGVGAFCAAARIVYSSPTQVNVVLPPSSGLAIRTYIVARVNGVLDAGETSGTPYAALIQGSSPSIFLAGADCTISAGAQVPVPGLCGIQPGLPGAGQVERGIITDLSGNILSSSNRARLGQYYVAWMTGLGANPKGFGSTIATLVPASGYPKPSGALLTVTYAGAVSVFPGLYQINFQIPLNVGEGPFGYGAWPCGDYNWELPISFSTLNTVSIPLTIKNGDVPCTP